MAEKVNIVMDQGTTFNTTFSFSDANDAPIDFSSYSANSQIRKSYTSSTAYNFTVGLGNNGVITLSMNAATSSTITAGRHPPPPADRDSQKMARGPGRRLARGRAPPAQGPSLRQRHRQWPAHHGLARLEERSFDSPYGGFPLSGYFTTPPETPPLFAGVW